MKLILENQSTKYRVKDTEYQLFIRQRGKPATYELLMRKNGCAFARKINVFKSNKNLRSVLQAIAQEQIKLDALWNVCATRGNKGSEIHE